MTAHTLRIGVRRLFSGRQLATTILVLLATATMVRLGFWQWGRLMERRATNALIERRTAESPVHLPDSSISHTGLAYRQVIVTGTWDFANEVVLRNRAYNGRPGVHILTPLHISGSDQAVLVDRGWIPATHAAPVARQAYHTTTSGVIRGVIHDSQPRTGWLSPVDRPAPGERRIDAWFRVDIPAIQQQIDTPLLPFWIQALPTSQQPALPWPEEPQSLDEGSHLGYAMQWWSFATILLVGYVMLAIRTTATEIRPTHTSH